jgi:RecB family exonuclease
VITPRRTRLIRVPDLHEFRRTIAITSIQEGGATMVVVPNRAAALQAERLVEPLALFAPAFLTRDELYQELHRRSALPALLTPLEREAIAQAAARDAFALVPDLSFNIRPGLVAAMLRFYDQLRRQSQSVSRFGELIEEALGGDDTADRGAERMLRQTRFMVHALTGYERRVAASGGCDEHLLRSRLMDAAVDAPPRHIVVTVADWIADPDGLFVADFDLLARIPGVEAVDIICTAGTLASGFHGRIREWLPGLEEIDAAQSTAPSAERTSPRPALIVPAGAPPEQPWFVRRDREEELLAMARTIGGSAQVAHALVYKRPLPYLYLAPTTLGAAGIAYETADALPLAAEPVAAAVDLILDAVETSFSRDALVALLHSPHFDFAGLAASRAAVSGFDRALSDKRYLGGIERLEAVVAEWPDDDTRATARAGMAIARDLQPLNAPATASHLLRTLKSILADHWVGLDPLDAFAARERRARAAVDGVLDSLMTAHAAHHDPDWTFADLAAAVRRWIQEKTFPAQPMDAARPDRARSVDLLDDQAARYGEFAHLSIVGLIEQDWPEPTVRNIFYPPNVLRTLGWPSENERRAAADARFVDLLASASQTVTLSTITLEDDALVNRSLQLDEVFSARLSTRPEELIDVNGLFADDSLVADPPRIERLNLLAKEWATLRIARPSSALPEFHGASGPRAHRTWSVSAVETYLECPFKFFARHVLALDEEPEDDEVLDPRRQGQFVHAVFEEFFRVWQDRGRGAITPGNLDDARVMFETVVDRQLAHAKLSPAEAGLERTRLLGSPAASGLGEAVFRMEAERPVPVVERLLEHTVSGELAIATAGGVRVVALRGKADRIDLLDDGTFRLIDYKLGWPPDRARALQLPIYGLFAEQRLQNHRGRRFVLGEAAYLAFKGPRRVVPLFSSPAQRGDVMARAQERLSAALDAIARGEFPPKPDDVYRCELCSFAAVCRKDYVDS